MGFNFFTQNISSAPIVYPSIDLIPSIIFNEDEGKFTDEEKALYRVLFDEFIELQRTKRITKFFWSSNGQALTHLEIRKSSGCFSAHPGTHIEIWDNGNRRIMSQRSLFFHEMGHLIVYYMSAGTSGSYPICEALPNYILAEANKVNPTRIYQLTGDFYPYPNWYKHAQKWNYPIVSRDNNHDEREDRNYVYNLLVLAYSDLKNGGDITKNKIVTDAEINAVEYNNLNNIEVTPVIPPIHETPHKHLTVPRWASEEQIRYWKTLVSPDIEIVIGG